MSDDQERLNKNCIIAEMIIKMSPSTLNSTPLKDDDCMMHGNKTIKLCDLDYHENWNSLIDACEAVEKIRIMIPTRFLNDINYNLTSQKKKGLFNSLSALSDWLKWRENMKLIIKTWTKDVT